jgi:outer membrane protein TolC
MKQKIIILLIFVGLSSIISAQTEELSLQNAVEIALENNYSIIISQKNAEVSEANNSWANTGAIPTVSFVGSGTASNNFNDSDNFSQTNLNGTVNVNWIIFRGFSARIQKDKLEEYENMSEANLAIMVENTIQNVISAYYGVLLSQAKLDISESNMNLSQDRYSRELQKKEIGTSVTYDLLQSKNAYLSDTADFMMSESSYRNAVRQLNYLMSVSVEKEYAFTTSFETEQSDFVYEDLMSKMKSNNTTLQNQYINLELSKLNVQSSKSAYYPTVSAGVSAGLQNSNMDYSTMDAMDNTNSAFSTSANIAISYDIYTGGSRKIAVDVAKIESEISDIQRVDLEQSLENQMAQEFELYNVRKELLFLAEENLKAADLNLELSKMKFESGVISSFNYRDIQTLHLNTALNYQNAVYNLIQSYYTLMRLTGGIVEDFN